ncbi:uncharacterized protein K02A2.6-like [Ornithodoros turicata]|uniref:uncharacterized protein K02A2.6-like n=1 Tax=Ornithodoros turicata TaxID=34597 RepID=UPI0031397A5E
MNDETPTQFEEEIVSVVTGPISREILQEKVTEDSTLQRIKKYVADGWPSKQCLEDQDIPYFHVREELSCIEDILLREDRIVVSTALTEAIVQNAHESHPGIVKTKQRLRDIFWWPRMDAQVEHVVRSCGICQAADKTAKPRTQPLTPVPFPSMPWEKLAIDITGPLEKASPDCRFAVTLVDYYSKWPEVFFSASVTSVTVITFLQQVFSREGYPQEIVSDNESQFKSSEFENFLKERGIKHLCSSLYYPQGNGLVERFNRTFKQYVQLASLERIPLRTAVTEYLGVFRTIPHSTTGQSPAKLLHGRQPRTRLDIVGIPTRQDPTETLQALREHVEQKQQYMKRITDERRRAKTTTFRPDDLVRIRIKPRFKAEPTYSKPVKILKQCGKN